MEKIKQFLKNKAFGYYLALGALLLAIIFTIIFVATFNNPACSDGSPVMGNKSVGLAPETIWIFLLAGIVAELVVLFLPQYRFLQVVVILLFGLALYKDIVIIPDFFAGIANGVMYNGGNLGLNLFYLIMLILIEIIAVVAIFIGFLKSEEETKQNFIPKDTPQIVKVGASGAVVIAALVVSLVVCSSLDKATGSNTSTKVNPITAEMKKAAEECEYDFDPTSIIIQEQEEWDFSNTEMKSLAYSSTREGHNLVYIFEGEYSEGYQNQYNTYLTGMYLWDDGMMVGKSNNDTFRGYWYNSSLTAPADDPETEENESIDCLNMVSDDEFTKSDGGASFTDKFFKSIITQPPMGGTDDFYECQAYVYMHPGWGKGRSVVVSGYKYYPDVAAFIDTNETTKMKVGEKFIVNSTWFFDKVIKNLKYTPIIPTSEVTWTIPEGMIDESKRLVAPGNYEITAKWKTYEATATLKVVE